MKMTGIITDIQHFSLHDGAGIRSTVFFKGCNMRCKWCHNPETLSAAPQQAHYPGKCIHCGRCATGCPAGARVTIGREMDEEQVMDAIMADLDYYEASGGGVTFSGGEPFVQSGFLLTLLSRCREAGIHTAAETNLSMPWDCIALCLAFLDYVYFDIKIMDDEAHRRWTGISNREILKNAAALAASGASFTVRTPLIPGATDSDENIWEIAAFVAGLQKDASYELLNYNVLAKSKYGPIGLTYSLPAARPLNAARLKDLMSLAAAQGVRCTVRKG